MTPARWALSGCGPPKVSSTNGAERKGPFGQVLHPPTSSCVADEHIQLAIGTEGHTAAVVVPILAAIDRAGLAGHRYVIGLPGSQGNHLIPERQEVAVPHEPVDAVSEQGDCARHGRIGPRCCSRSTR